MAFIVIAISILLATTTLVSLICIAIDLQRSLLGRNDIETLNKTLTRWIENIGQLIRDTFLRLLSCELHNTEEWPWKATCVKLIRDLLPIGLVIYSMSAIEFTLFFNHVRGVYCPKSSAQIIPVAVGAWQLLHVLWERFGRAMWSKYGPRVTTPGKIIVADNSDYQLHLRNHSNTLLSEAIDLTIPTNNRERVESDQV
jgi:hypothetical protein